MAVEWGIKQTAGIGAKWVFVPLEETLIIEPNVVYQFNFSVPEVKWWQIFLLWGGFDPAKFVTSFQKEMAEKAGIRPEEIKIVWQKYSPVNKKIPASNKVYSLYICSNVPAQITLPIGLDFLTGIIIIGVIAVAFNVSLGWLVSKLGIDITSTLEEIKKLVVEVRGKK